MSQLACHEVPRRQHLASLIALAVFLLVLASSRSVSLASPQAPTENTRTQSQITVPPKPDTSLYKGEQGAQQSEIKFAPSTRTVTIKLHVEDPNGYFLPNLHPENFAVYEDGVRQKNVSVEVEHAAVSVGLLMEAGSRYHEINKLLEDSVPRVGRKFLDVIGPGDKIAIFKYDSKLQTLSDFGQDQKDLSSIFKSFSMPEISEANLYDALIETLNRMKNVTGRKAVVVISSGVDTFSKASFQEVLEAAQECAVPIYTIGLGPMMQLESAVYGEAAPFGRIDWKGAEKRLEDLAKTSGGRAYAIETTADVAGIYDDIMENLRVRYVINYMSSNPATTGPPRKIQVELIDPQTGHALKIHDSNGKAVTARVFVQESFNPGAPARD